jgi:sulfur carrier protein ThiS
MSCRIAVELSPIFQSRLGVVRLSLTIAEECSTVKGVLRSLSEGAGAKIKPLLYSGEGILAGLMVMVNDRIFTGSALNQQDVSLRDGDKVSLLYYVSGG